MFGKFLKKVAKPDNHDALERALGKDLDGDGDIGGKPIAQPAADKPAQRTGDAPAAEPAGLDFGALMSQGQMLLSNSGALKPTKEGGLMGMLDGFKGMNPQVQARANAEVQKLDDGHDMPLSSLDGNRKSLLVGINYPGTQSALRGCINDVKNVQEFITTKFNFPTDAQRMRVLTDDQTDRSKLPTRQNIIDGMKWLIAGAKSGDSLFFHYSGHGAYAKDVKPDTDEADGQDETLVPCDYKTAGMIIDDEIFEILVAPLPKGVRLTAITDCCHSGSVFDLPYSYVLDGEHERAVEIDHRKMAMAAAMAAGKALLAKDYGTALKQLMAAGKSYMAMNASANDAQSGAGADAANSSDSAPEPSFVTPPSQAPTVSAPAPSSSSSSSSNSSQSQASSNGNITTNANVAQDYISIRTALADVIQLSGCKDTQTSADAFIGGESCGAMSFALIKAFEDHGLNQSYSELLRNIRTTLLGKYSQIPQMSTGHRMMNLDGPFKM